jgi:thioredoxin-like negative regulator of GroEL
MATVKVTDSSFEADVLKSDIPVVVDFWAEWKSWRASMPARSRS